ncbi:MAG: flagellar basal body rod protein FlgC [Phycisphaerales bacterium]|nr:flagellar basal body rod protein FlgC [Phycisphaerales bacterium]
MFGMLDISTSALIAQRTRLTVNSANIAGKDAILNAKGEYDPFRRRIAILEAGDGRGGQGAHVREIRLDQSPLRPKYEPGSPFADERGYVFYPNVDPITEQVNALEASRAYEANITAVEATKSMMTSALRIIA